MTAAYFVPTHQEREDLAAAARRGVKVRLMLPDQGDSPSATAVAHSGYADLLEAGVQREPDGRCRRVRVPAGRPE